MKKRDVVICAIWSCAMRERQNEEKWTAEKNSVRKGKKIIRIMETSFWLMLGNVTLCKIKSWN